MSNHKEVSWMARLVMRTAGFSYSNLARLFMRLFSGVMFGQFGVRHLVDYNILKLTFPTVLGMSPEATLTLMIIIELACSTLIIIGLLTRLATVMPIVSMVLAEWYIVHDLMQGWALASLDSIEPGYVPIMFIGLFLYLILAGPGKISLDYLISLKIIEDNSLSEEEELEEV